MHSSGKLSSALPWLVDKLYGTAETDGRAVNINVGTSPEDLGSRL